MDAALLDTDILSEVLKRKDRRVLANARQYLAEHQRFAFSAITAYEVIRGLRSKRATRQLAGFLKTMDSSDVFAVTTPILLRASELWAGAIAGGHPHDDADLFIAATALEHGRVLVTGNSAHFSWIAGIRLDDWRQP
jgi:tRNA(fMet)-specific endonuclease VapC